MKWKFSHNSEIKRILWHKHLPKWIKKQKEIKHIQKESKNWKDSNVRANSKPGALPYVAEWKEKIRDVED